MTASAAVPWFADAQLLGVERALEPPGALPHVAAPPRRRRARQPVRGRAGRRGAAARRHQLPGDPRAQRRRPGPDGGDDRRHRARSAASSRTRGPAPAASSPVASRAVGERHWAPELPVGERVVPLASLIVDPAAARRGRPGRRRTTRTCPPAGARSSPAGWRARRCRATCRCATVAERARRLPGRVARARPRRPGDHVLVLGAGHAGLLAAAAAHAAVGPEGA